MSQLCKYGIEIFNTFQEFYIASVQRFAKEKSIFSALPQRVQKKQFMSNIKVPPFIMCVASNSTITEE